MTPPPTTDPSPPSPSSSSPSSPSVSDEVEIREVWDDNLESEICLIRDIIDEYPYVAMDTEFPGIVLRPLAPSPTPTYSTLKANVDLLKLIQLGLTLTDSLGRLPRIGPHRRPSLWQFNFRDFDPLVDVFARDSLDLLRRSGIDFQLNSTRGIPCLRFAEFLISSGVVLNPDVQWITFHSGYDFGYLLKALTCRPLPDTLEGFFELIDVYFPVIYDMKHLMKYCNSLHGGLNRLAELLEVERIGVSHQAGSDSLLTGEAFRKLRDVYFGGDASKYAGVLFGLEMNTTTTTTTTGVTNAAGVNAITTAGISIPRCV